MKFNLLSSILILVSLTVTKIKANSCLHDAMVHPPQANCRDRGGHYIIHYSNNGCSSHKVCLIPTGNNKIFPDGIKAKKYSECVIIEETTYCAADLIENIPCENCTFSELLNELKNIMGENLEFKFSYNSTITIPPEQPDKNVKIQCVNEKIINEEDKKCWLSDGIFIKHEFYPDCDKSYYACFYSNIDKNTEGIDSNIIISKDQSKCIKKDDMSFCAVGYTNIPCQGCTFTEFTKKAKDIFGDYLTEEIGITSIEDDHISTSTSTLTSNVTSSSTSGIKISLHNSFYITSFILICKV